MRFLIIFLIISMVLIFGQNAFALPAKMDCTSILDEWARVNYPSGNFVHDIIPPVIIDGKNTSFFIKAEQSTKNDNHIQLEMKLLDRNDHVMKNSRFFVELSQDDKIIHRDLFYTDSGTLVLDFDQNNSTKETTVDAEQANMGYFFSSNDHITIKSPTLDGTYQLKVMAMGACDRMVFFFPHEAVPVFQGSFLVSDGHVTSVTVLKDSNPEKIASPLKQIKSGIKYHNVQCNEGLELVYKKGDNTSACVIPETKIELTVRGWAEPLGNVVFEKPSLNVKSVSRIKTDQYLLEILNLQGNYVSNKDIQFYVHEKGFDVRCFSVYAEIYDSSGSKIWENGQVSTCPPGLGKSSFDQKIPFPEIKIGKSGEYQLVIESRGHEIVRSFSVLDLNQIR